MRNKYIESFEQAQLENNNIPEFRAKASSKHN